MGSLDGSGIPVALKEYLEDFRRKLLTAIINQSPFSKKWMKSAEVKKLLDFTWEATNNA